VQPRSLQQILSELDNTYNPQVDSIRQRQALIPGQIQAEEQGLQAKQGQAFDDILGGARRRGLGFAGIPLQEQAKYTATEYMPALARLKQSGREQAMSLEDAILGIQERKNTMGQQIFQQEQDRAEQARQFNAKQGGGFQWPTGGGNVQGAATSATATKRADGGFNFTDAAGRPISAAAFAAAKGLPFRQLLSDMAKQGDAGAKTALGFVGDDFGYDAKKINSQSLAELYNNLVWGTGKQATYKAPQKNKVQQAATQVSRANAPTIGNAQRIQSFFSGAY
jgi:hypothetical protein